MGIIRHANPGCYHLLPLGLRSIEKLTKIIDDEMKSIEAQKLAMPYLTNSDLWKRTGNNQFNRVTRSLKRFMIYQKFPIHSSQCP